MKQRKQTISVLIEREGDWWIAQCIEQDLVTQAQSLDELHYEIELMLVAHIASCEERGIEPFSLRPAPPEVREKFERARTEVTSRAFSDVHAAQLQHRPLRAETRICA